MKKMIAAATVAVCLVPAAASAKSLVDAAVYGSWAKLTDDVGTDAKGSGGGARVRIGLPLTSAFATAEYQQNRIKDDSSGLKGDLSDGRIGIGSGYSLGVVSLEGRAEYVQLQFDPSGGTRDHDDGFGLHVGADAGIGIAGVYGSVGYTRLSDTDGPEIALGVRASLIPTLRVFAEWRHTALNDRSSGPTNDGKFNDYHVGVGFSF